MFVERFEQLSRNSADIAGGKGASLGEMKNAGIPVPPGYVVLSIAFDRFLEKTDLNVEIEAILGTVDHQKVHTVEKASEEIQALILDAKMPEDIKNEIEDAYKKLFEYDIENLPARRSHGEGWVAVRSSATAEDGQEHAWAGQLNSYLNTTEEILLKNIQKCWASLFTPRAIFYRFEKGLHDTHISVAVVVQKMIQSEKSGIAFSVHPVTEDFNQLIIEAGFGLGEAIVSGSITPDSYVVDKSKVKSLKSESEGIILDINVSTQTKGLFRKENGGNEWRDIPEPQASSQVLSEKEIAELSDLIIKIENHYGFPCDIEWAYEGGKFYITQSRPITTLKNNLPKEKITLYNHQTREHSLFYASVWSDSNLHDYSNYGFSNIKNLVFQRDGKSDRLRVYYDSKEIEEINKEIKELANNDNNFFSKVEKDIKYFTDELVKYIDGKVAIENLDDLRLFYDLWRKWWTPMAIVFVIPSNLEIKEDIRNNALSIRQKIEKHSDNIDKLFVKFFQKYYPEYKEIASVVSANEVFSLDSGKFTQDKLSEIRSRLDGGAIVNNIFLGDQDLEKELEKNNIILEKTEADKSTDIITGVSANAGNIKGRVRIVKQKNEIEYFEEGEILVTHMTSPDYLVAVKKAAAIITDEGGITCHAAIVARELKIPCIIGTKIATQVLKDGDLVEVDAEKGVVKILEREK